MQEPSKEIILDYAVSIAKPRRALRWLTPVLCVPGAVFLVSFVYTHVRHFETWIFSLMLVTGILSIVCSPWAAWRVHKQTTGSAFLDWLCAVISLFSGVIGFGTIIVTFLSAIVVSGMKF